MDLAGDAVAGSTLDWVKSSRSLATGACLEFATVGNLIALRDSKNPDVAPFLFTRAEIDAFLHGAKQGEFDHLV
jgi:Domain of unknown function (DUF397)